MWKKAVLALLTAAGLSFLLSQLLKNYFPLSDKLLQWNLFFNGILFTVIIAIYLLSYRMADFPGLLLVIMVLRLLLSLTYVLVISFLEKEVFRSMALRFMCDFVIYTIADIWLASRLLRNKKFLN